VSWVDLVVSLVDYQGEDLGEDLGSWRVTLGDLEDLVEEPACLVVVGLGDRFAEDEA
jgi:hypothetical protein